MLPWYPRDWFASDAYDSMTLEQQGAYRNLIDRAFQRPGCVLPADDDRLRQLAGATPKEWIRVREVVLRWFPEHGAGRVNARALREWRKAKKLRTKARRKAKDAAKRRWDKEKQARSGDAPSMPGASSENALPSPTPTPSPNANAQRQRHPTAAAASGAPEALNGGPPPPGSAQPDHCPRCKNPGSLRQRADGSGWFCGTRAGGCDAKFAIDDPAILAQLRPEVAAAYRRPEDPESIERAARRRGVEALLSRCEPVALTWGDIYQQLEAVMPRQSFATWIRPIQCLGIVRDDEGERLFLGLPSEAHLVWVERNYAQTIRTVVAEIDPDLDVWLATEDEVRRLPGAELSVGPGSTPGEEG